MKTCITYPLDKASRSGYWIDAEYSSNVVDSIASFLYPEMPGSASVEGTVTGKLVTVPLAGGMLETAKNGEIGPSAEKDNEKESHE